MSNLKEYVVTLHKLEDLEEFYKDMETLRATAYNCMPERAVEVAARRPTSRNTHYWLTPDEVAVLKTDPRVRSIELKPSELGLTIRPSWVQFSENWNKSNTLSNNHVNWGLLRTVEGQTRTGWGTGGVASQSGSVSISEEGRDVDIVIVDGHFNPAHPEYAVNKDGSGGSRVVQLDWHTLTSEVSSIDDDNAGTLKSSYIYGAYTGGTDEQANNHGAHVAGIAAGNTQGWARKANIYNISPYADNPNVFSELVLIDYIRAFHRTKPVNPKTGKKNPTICNHSWGFGYLIDLASNPVTSITFRGNTITGTFSETQLKEYGIYVKGNESFIPANYDALNADMEDAIEDGIITVAAASNDYTKIDVPGGEDYDNSCIFGNSQPFYYHRGSSPGNAKGVICVGSVDILATEQKAQYSNSGPRIDIWAPGSYIISSVNSTGVPDSRNSEFYLTKASGTSMAAPQVCGVLACILETYPSLTPAQALSYIKSHAKIGQLKDSTNALDDYHGLHGAPNLYLAYHKERPTAGRVFPKINYNPRPAVGAVFPRIRKS